MDLNCFNDKVVIVTGGSRGIGKSIVKEFVRKGAVVILNYNKSKDAAEKIKEECKDFDGKIELFKADVSLGKEVEAMVDFTVNKYSKIDILINNAGIKKDGYLAMMSDSDWTDVINTNLTSIYHTCKWVSRIMMQNRKGKIINISSLSAIKGIPGQINYAASKGALISFTKALACETANYGLHVNAIVPGFIETDMTNDIADKRKTNLIDIIPLKRFGSPDDVVGGVLFFASNLSDYVTGQTLVIDGGISA